MTPQFLKAHFTYASRYPKFSVVKSNAERDKQK